MSDDLFPNVSHKLTKRSTQPGRSDPVTVLCIIDIEGRLLEERNSRKYKSVSSCFIEFVNYIRSVFKALSSSYIR